MLPGDDCVVVAVANSKAPGNATNKRFILTGDQEAKVRAEIAEMQKRIKEGENNFDYLLGHIKYKRPYAILPKLNGSGCPLGRKKPPENIGIYRLTTYDSDDEGTREHDYCNPQRFEGFTKNEVFDSTMRWFQARDSEFLVAEEADYPQEEPKEPLHITLDLTETELIRSYDHITHYGYLLDPNYKLKGTSSPASVIELEPEGFDEKLLSAMLPRNDIPDDILPSHDIPDDILPSNEIDEILMHGNDIPDYGLPMEDINDNLLSVDGRGEEVEKSLDGSGNMDLLPDESHPSAENMLPADQVTDELFQLSESDVTDPNIYINDNCYDANLERPTSSSVQNNEPDMNPHGASYPDSSSSQNVPVISEGTDELPSTDFGDLLALDDEDEDDSIRSGCIVAAGDSEGEFVGDADTYSRADTPSHFSDLSLPNFHSDVDSGSEVSFSRPSSARGWESDAASTCTSGISLLDIDSNVEPNLGENYGHCPDIPINTTWPYRVHLARSGCHRPMRSSMHIGPEGAYSLLLINALIARDFGDSLLLYGESSTANKGKRNRRRSTFNKRRKKYTKKCDQTMSGGNLALYQSMVYERPIRVVRSHTMKSAFSPTTGYRYEGLFYVYSAHAVKSYELIREFRFLLMAEPDFIASRNTPRFWQLEGKLPSVTPELLQFGHPRDTVLCKGVQRRSSPQRRIDAAISRISRETRQSSRSYLKDKSQSFRLTRSVSAESLSGVRTRSQTRMSSHELPKTYKPERTMETRLSRSTRSMVSEPIGGRTRLRNLLKTCVENDIQSAMPSTVVRDELLRNDRRKRLRSGSGLVDPASEGPLEDNSFPLVNVDTQSSEVKMRRRSPRGVATPGTSASKQDITVQTRSRNRRRHKKANWLEKVVMWKTVG